MDTDLDTLATAVDVRVDDLLRDRPELTPPGPRSAWVMGRPSGGGDEVEAQCPEGEGVAGAVAAAGGAGQVRALGGLAGAAALARVWSR